MKKVELLAPAGSMEAFFGAVHAGADAIYLGGEQFGARAYAKNLTEDEILQAIDYAIMRNKKVYLTMNTLVKEREFDQIYPVLKPLYENGLQGIIIQDLGVLQYVKENFPDLELHASTQMTITSALGASFLHEQGVKRIVPARELSLSEIADIKQKVPVDIECFVHGAMCYCYSGQCLFSSMVGGRSGNRGRCAQPCRLPYQVLEDGKKIFSQDENYVLSLKDMYTLPMIPKLIGAGIDSFKIEGRMKKPEYAAGVTSIYRKYLDIYYENPEKYKQSMMSIKPEDEKKIQSLYIRSELMSGYYEKHNGKEMITLNKPTYEGTDEALFEDIRKQYIEAIDKKPVQAFVSLKKNLPSKLIITFENREGEVLVAECEGDTVEESINRPLMPEDVRKQIEKMGATDFYISDCNIEMDEHIFLNNKSLNSLRRTAVEILTKQITAPYQRSLDAKINSTEKNIQNMKQDHELELEVLVSSQEQLQALISRDMIKNNTILMIEVDLLIRNPQILTVLQESQLKFYIALPYIIRKNTWDQLATIKSFMEMDCVDGIMIRNLEALQFLKEEGISKKIMADRNLYTWNQSAETFYRKNQIQYSAPLELNLHELAELKSRDMSVLVYGYIPFMISANCIKKTTTGCDKIEEELILTDRTNAELTVMNRCLFCYNVLYNSVPISLHQNIEELLKTGFYRFRLDFTKETGAETIQILSFFQTIQKDKKNKEKTPYEKYTKGHLKRGVL